MTAACKNNCRQGHQECLTPDECQEPGYGWQQVSRLVAYCVAGIALLAMLAGYLSAKYL